MLALICLQCAQFQAKIYTDWESTTTAAPYFVNDVSTEQSTTYIMDYTDMPYDTEFEVEYDVEWYNMNEDIRVTDSKRAGLPNTDYYMNDYKVGGGLYIDGDDRTVMISAKEYILKNIHYFDVSPLPIENNRYRNLQICRVGSFPSQEGRFKKVNLCYKPQNYREQSPFITTIETKRFGNCQLRWDVEHNVASITLYIALGIIAVALILGLLTKGAKMGYKKYVALRSGSIDAEYQHI